jgi:hypothetical protein
MENIAPSDVADSSYENLVSVCSRLPQEMKIEIAEYAAWNGWMFAVANRLMLVTCQL